MTEKNGNDIFVLIAIKKFHALISKTELLATAHRQELQNKVSSASVLSNAPRYPSYLKTCKNNGWQDV